MEKVRLDRNLEKLMKNGTEIDTFSSYIYFLPIFKVSSTPLLKSLPVLIAINTPEFGILCFESRENVGRGG